MRETRTFATRHPAVGNLLMSRVAGTRTDKQAMFVEICCARDDNNSPRRRADWISAEANARR
ncbi:hypothetical protein [Micromonospora matsumotoense]|uniref:hypothetical protein n=1 Tax=Micromonospora matsumotoense TaxID=121616 RepID=UPI0033FB584D